MNNSLNAKITFCPGPGAVIPEWFSEQKEYFGRGDEDYTKLKKKTLNWLKKISGQDEIIPIPGAGTTAAIVAFNTFLNGRIAVLKTGYYSKRWYDCLKGYKNLSKVKYIDYQDFIKLDKLKKFDWVVFVYVETASCKKFDLPLVKKICSNSKIRLMIDSTASIGLEINHILGDVIFFSSCKGLFGPTGLGFIAYKKKIKKKHANNFLLDYRSHQDSKYTLGYNCMASLYAISKKHRYFKKKIIFAGNYLKQFTLFNINNPKIGIALKYKLKNRKNSKSIFYIPREKKTYDVIFFLGIIKYDQKDIKKILKDRIIKNLKL